MLPKIHDIYALIGGFGYQEAPCSVDSTVATASSLSDLGIDQNILPTQASTVSSQPDSNTDTPTPLDAPSYPTGAFQPGFFTRIINK